MLKKCYMYTVKYNFFILFISSGIVFNLLSHVGMGMKIIELEI